MELKGISRLVSRIRRNSVVGFRIGRGAPRLGVVKGRRGKRLVLALQDGSRYCVLVHWCWFVDDRFGSISLGSPNKR
jgi:hypothetical protein